MKVWHVILLFPLVILAIFGAFQFQAAQVPKLEASAKTFMTNLGYEVRGAQCLRIDSDGDGYQSCTVSVAGEQPIALECRTFSGDCRIAKKVLQ